MNTRLKNPVVYIVGPTASGKTSLSIELAKAFNGEIICGDSMQIYKNMSIATAAPTDDEKQNIKHRMFEFLNPSEGFSVSDYTDLAKKEIEKVKSLGKLPFVVGGTGLYISSLAENIDFGKENGDGSIRKMLEEKAENCGLAVLYDELLKIDKEFAEKISENDAKRILRGLEVYYSSGETMSARIKKSKDKGKIYDNIFIFVTYEDRDKLYERINRRVDLMVEAGLVEEAKRCINTSAKTAAQAIGHKELKPYFDGEISLSEALEHLKMQTRRYAKRQITWFSKIDGINVLYMDKSENPVKDATDIINSNLY